MVPAVWLGSLYAWILRGHGAVRSGRRNFCEAEHLPLSAFARGHIVAATSTAVALGRRDVVDSEQIAIRGSPILPPLHSNTCSPAHAFVAKARDDW
jgi:hypothetical protein